MAGSFALAVALVIIGIIATVALPGAGLVIGLVLVVVAVLLVLGGFRAGRRAGNTPRA